ncbi:hypothetical protein A2U01_0056705, partial [Trifolium medium]|nr:hypothetical protein [Trifolium medium]
MMRQNLRIRRQWAYGAQMARANSVSAH